MTNGDEIRHSVGRLSPRARAYCFAAGLRHFGLGFIAIWQAGQFSKALSFRTIQDLSFAGPSKTMALWGVIFIFCSLGLFHAALSARDSVARWALLFSVLITSLWSGAFIATALDPPDPLMWAVPAVWAITWIALTIKDTTMLRSPLANPFEQIFAPHEAVETAEQAVDTTKDAVAVSEKAVDLAKPERGDGGN